MKGVRAAQDYYHAHGYGLAKNVRPEDVIKLYLPPVNEMMLQISTPMPQPRVDWMRGFKEEQANILMDIDKDI